MAQREKGGWIERVALSAAIVAGGASYAGSDDSPALNNIPAAARPGDLAMHMPRGKLIIGGGILQTFLVRWKKVGTSIRKKRPGPII